MPVQANGKIKEKVRALPHGPGVYLMKDRFGHIIYVGKAKDLKKRVSTYFQASRRLLTQQPKIRALLHTVYDLEVVEVRSEAEALLLEGRLIKQWKPKYNTDFTDDKRFLLVRVDTTAALPRFRLTRIRKDEQSWYFGPFAHAGLLRRTLAEMRREFGILLGDAKPVRQGDGRWLLYDDMRSEIYGHANQVSGEEYRERVERACVFLEGKSRKWLSELRDEMNAAAQKLEFEQAARLRDIVFALEKTLLRTRKFQRDPLKPVAPAAVLEQLRNSLGLATVPKHLECFDISHISGTFVVASLVHFRGGNPDRSQYRRYRIRGFIGNDDFRAMQEVVGRRYRRLSDEGKRFPDLVVIDGGKGQLGAALRAFFEHDLEPPPIIGLAKREETVVFPDERPPLRLDRQHEGLKLLQRIRDEAHRFANAFNAELRSRRIRETILDDFEGLGPVRRRALFERFKSLRRLKKASESQLQEVEGIGPKLACRLHAFLSNR